MRPNNARRLFPCFDVRQNDLQRFFILKIIFQEPAFKVPFIVSIARPKNFMTLFNTPVKSSDEM